MPYQSSIPTILTHHKTGATVTDQHFGVARSSSNTNTGVMGVGPPLEPAPYPDIIDELASQGITNSRAFSLDLRTVNSPEGMKHLHLT
jgi:hypothetical protein